MASLIGNVKNYIEVGGRILSNSDLQVLTGPGIQEAAQPSDFHEFYKSGTAYVVPGAVYFKVKAIRVYNVLDTTGTTFTLGYADDAAGTTPIYLGGSTAINANSPFPSGPTAGSVIEYAVDFNIPTGKYPFFKQWDDAEASHLIIQLIGIEEA